MYDNKFEPKENKIWTRELRKGTTTYIYIILGVPSHTSHLRALYV